MKPKTSFVFTHFLASVVVNGTLILLALWLGEGLIAFLLFSIIFLYLGRKTGWFLSRELLYSSKMGTAIFACVAWGCATALLVRLLISWQHPHWALKYVLGYAQGAYVAIPNFGFVAESTIPPHAMKRHELLCHLPLWTYFFASVTFAYLL